MPRITRTATPLVELAAGEVVEEEQRLGALHEHVVHAHRDQVDADACRGGPSWKASLSLVPTPSVPETSTGSRYFFGIAHSAPKPPMPRQHLRPQGALGERLDRLDEGIARVDVDAGVAVGERFRSWQVK